MSDPRDAKGVSASAFLALPAGLTVGVLALFEEWTRVAGAVVAFAAAALVLWHGDDDREEREPT